MTFLFEGVSSHLILADVKNDKRSKGKYGTALIGIDTNCKRKGYLLADDK